MKINGDAIRMYIVNSNFYTHSSGTNGAIFYIENLGMITMTNIDAADFNAPTGGRFIY